jgi:hypothetical protein
MARSRRGGCGMTRNNLYTFPGREATDMVPVKRVGPRFRTLNPDERQMVFAEFHEAGTPVAALQAKYGVKRRQIEVAIRVREIRKVA